MVAHVMFRDTLRWRSLI